METHFTKKYLEAFAFTSMVATENSVEFFFLYENCGHKYLYCYNVENHDSLENGERLSEVDFNKQGFFPIRVCDGNFYFVSDEDNKENFNIFSLNLDTKEIKKHTHNDYTSCVRIEDDLTCYYSSRKIDSDGLFSNEIHCLNLKTGADEVVTNDRGDLYRISWGPILSSLDGKFLALSVDKQNLRTNTNYCLYNRKTKIKTLLIPEQYESRILYIMEDHLNLDMGFYFVSDVSGHCNIYYLDFHSKEVAQLTTVDYITDGFNYLFSEGKRYFYHSKFVPSEGKSILIFHQEDKVGCLTKLEKELEFDGEIEVYSKEKDFVWVKNSNLTKVPECTLFKIKDSKIVTGESVPFVKKSDEGLVHSRYEFVTYKSFDGVEVPGYVTIPHGEIKGAVITAFYGGSNRYTYFYQIFSELGFVCLTPAVRGSWGHGKEWESMIVGDLGGSEILDLIWGAKFLEERFKLKPSQIGVEGGSHGGYSTLRALTLPSNFKTPDSKYPFGFGICWAGFADLEDFYKTSNIPDWLAYMLGPYEENKELYEERSPVNHVENLSAPLFITHGTQDSRVPPSTMDGFLSKLKVSKVPHYIYMMDGQGHTGGSLDERVDEFIEMFNFLEKETQLGFKK